VNIKWVDNVLSHFAISGVQQSRQGIARRISADGVLELALIRRLSQTLGMPLETAVARSKVLAETGEFQLGGGSSVQMNRAQEWAELEDRLEYAVEAAPLPKRGRPPKKAKRGAD
jgi:hypothetical protein